MEDLTEVQNRWRRIQAFHDHHARLCVLAKWCDHCRQVFVEVGSEHGSCGCKHNANHASEQSDYSLHPISTSLLKVQEHSLKRHPTKIPSWSEGQLNTLLESDIACYDAISVSCGLFDCYHLEFLAGWEQPLMEHLQEHPRHVSLDGRTLLQRLENLKSVYAEPKILYWIFVDSSSTYPQAVTDQMGRFSDYDDQRDQTLLKCTSRVESMGIPPRVYLSTMARDRLALGVSTESCGVERQHTHVVPHFPEAPATRRFYHTDLSAEIIHRSKNASSIVLHTADSGGHMQPDLDRGCFDCVRSRSFCVADGPSCQECRNRVRKCRWYNKQQCAACVGWKMPCIGGMPCRSCEIADEPCLLPAKDGSWHGLLGMD